MPDPADNLLCLLRGEPPPGPLSATDWQELARTAARHQLAPWLYWQVAGEAEQRGQPAPAPAPPPAVVNALREAFLKTAARNALLYHNLAQVLGALQSAGIQVAVLKGAHLAALIYPQPGFRPMADTDLLLPPDQLDSAHQLLLSLGYTPRAEPGFPAPALPLGSQAAPLAKHLPCYDKHPHPRIEIHWTIEQPVLAQTLDLAALRARLRPVHIAGVETHVLAPEDMVLYQCTHLAGHRFACHGLRPFCDLAVTLRHFQSTLDWPVIAARAREWRAESGVYLALRLARELLGAPLPADFLERLRLATFDEHYYELARESVFLPATDTGGDETEVNFSRVGILADGLTEQSLRGRIRFLVRSALPDRRHMAAYMAHHHALPLSGHRRYTCYLTRMLDLARHGSHFLAYSLTHRGATAQRTRQLQRQARLWRWLTTPP